MAWSLKSLQSWNKVQAEINGKWVPARPLRLSGWEGFRLRFKDAMLVLRDKAEAFTWPEGQ